MERGATSHTAEGGVDEEAAGDERTGEGTAAAMQKKVTAAGRQQLNFRYPTYLSKRGGTKKGGLLPFL